MWSAEFWPRITAPNAVRTDLRGSRLLGHAKDSLWSLDLFRTESILLEYPLGSGRHGSVYPPDHRLWCAGRLRRWSALCRMFNQAISGEGLPTRLSTDHDPLFQFHRWQANLRILDVETVQTVPQVPWSHPFVERLIGTIRREYLDHLFFWTADDLERKLELFKNYYNAARVHQGLSGDTPGEKAGGPTLQPAGLENYRWQSHCHGLFELPIAA